MPDKYDLQSVKLPRFTGWFFSFFVSLLESPLTRWLFISPLLKQGGFTALREMLVDEPPTFQPAVPPAAQPAAQGQNLQVFHSLESHSPVTQKGFHFNTVMDYARAYRDGSTTPEQVAQRILTAIDSSQQLDPAMNIFIAWNKDDLMQQARQSTERFRVGKPISILDGVPVPVKDELDMLPYPSTVGTSFLGKTPVKEDSSAAARVRATGALMVGKCNMHEIGIGVTGLNPHHGTVRNPYNPQHHTGGSSSGPAASVSAGFGPFALGADGGGSIRIPAGFCGMVGLKPTFGRVSEFGAAPLGWSVAHIGPIGVTALDTAIGYSILGGADARDLHTLGQPDLSMENLDRLDLSDISLGVYWPWFRHATPEVVVACEAMLKGLQSLGAKVQEVEIPDLEASRVAHVVTISSEMNTGLERYYKEHHKEYSLEVRLDLATSRAFQTQDYIIAQRIRTRLIASMEQVFTQVNFIVTPATAVVAPPVRPDSLPNGDSDISLLTEIMRYAPAVNLTGHPAISFPAGYSAAGLPIGFQAMGRYWQENQLLRLARAAETLVDRQKPQVYYDLLA